MPLNSPVNVTVTGEGFGTLAAGSFTETQCSQ